MSPIAPIPSPDRADASSAFTKTFGHQLSASDISRDPTLPPTSRPVEAADQIGDYKILSKIGHGGMGIVYCAEDCRLHRRVALKVIQVHLADRPKFRERFLSEARSQANIEHENITPIYQAGEDNGRLYIAMPVLHGESLRVRLDREKVPPIRFTLRVGQQIAEGLAAAHSHGVMHRDIKPANVWIEDQSKTALSGGSRPVRVRLLDFGLARAIKADENIALTGAGDVIGTPAYMSPEQAMGGDVDERVDLYSLGVILYEMTAGILPFTGDSPVSVIMKAAQDKPIPVSEINTSVPPDLARLIERLMSRDPVVKPTSATEVADELHRIAEDQDGAVRPRPTRGRRGLVVAGGILLIVGSALAVGLFFTQQPNKPAIVQVTPPTRVDVPVTAVVGDDRMVTVRVTPSDAAVTAATDPPGMLMRVGGSDSGHYLVTLGPDPLTFRVEKAGYESQVVTVAPDRLTDYAINLEPTPTPVFRVEFLDLPPDSELSIEDDGTIRPLPGEPNVFVLTRRTQEVRVRAPGYQPKTVTVSPGPDATTELTVDLVALPPPAEITDSIGIALRLIPAGTAVIGTDPAKASDVSDPFVDQNERKVELTRPFYLGRTEVTRGQFRKFIVATAYRTRGPRRGYDPDAPLWFRLDPKFSWEDPGFDQSDDHPVVNVTWDDAVAFCDWLSEKEGKTYRLPSEAEWEYAARLSSSGLALDATTEDTLGRANLADESLVTALAVSKNRPRTLAGTDGHGFTAPVGSRSAGSNGLHDMFGNAAEWCLDWYGDWAKTATRDPVQPAAHPDGLRVIRGGSFLTGTVPAVYRRYHLPADAADMQTGFRVLVEIPARSAGE